MTADPRPQDAERPRRVRKGAPSPETRSLLHEYQRAMRTELRILLREMSLRFVRVSRVRHWWSARPCGSSQYAWRTSSEARQTTRRSGTSNRSRHVARHAPSSSEAHRRAHAQIKCAGVGADHLLLKASNRRRAFLRG